VDHKSLTNQSGVAVSKFKSDTGMNETKTNHRLCNVAAADTDHNNEKLVHVSVGSQSVWAVTDAGNIYFRTGVTQPLSSPLHPAWLCVSDRKKSLIRFCQVVTSENDLVVIIQCTDYAVKHFYFIYLGASMVRMGWRPAGLSMHLPLIFPTPHKIQNDDRLPQHVLGVSE